MKAPIVAVLLSLASSAPVLAGTFVYVSNAEDGDIGMYTLQADGSLQPGQRFLYLYDYGDQWLCGVEVEAIIPAPKRGEFPRVVEREGKAPPQYPTWE